MRGGDLVKAAASLLQGNGTRAELVRGSAAGALLAVGDTLLGLLSLVVLARNAGPAGVGAYAVAMAIVTLIGIPAQSGLPILVLREIGSCSATHNWPRIRGILTFANVAVLSVSATLAGGLAVATYMISPHLTSIQAHAILLASLLLPMTALSGLRSATLRGFGKIVVGQLPDALIRPGAYLVLLVLTTTLAPGRLSAGVAILLQIVAAALGLATGAWMLVKAIPPEVRRAAPEFRVHEWLRSSVPFAVSVLLRTAQPNLAVLLVSTLCSVEATGLFRLAQRAADLVAFAGNTVVALTPPYVSRFFAAGDTARLQRLITLTARAATAGAAVVGGGLVVLGPTILPHLFGNTFARSYPQMLVLIVAQIITAAFGANALLMNMAHQERALSLAFLVGLIVQVAATLVLATSMGSIGAAYALVASECAWNGLIWWVARRKLAIRTTAFGL